VRVLFFSPLYLMIILYTVPHYSYAFVVEGDEVTDFKFACERFIPKLVLVKSGSPCFVNYNGCIIETSVSKVDIKGEKVLLKTSFGNINICIDNTGILVYYDQTKGINIYAFVGGRVYHISPNYVELLSATGDVLRIYKNEHLKSECPIIYYTYYLDNSKLVVTIYSQPSMFSPYYKVYITINLSNSNSNVKFSVVKVSNVPARLLYLNNFYTTLFVIFHGINGYKLIASNYIPYKLMLMEFSSTEFGISQLTTRVLLAILMKLLLNNIGIVNVFKYIPFNVIVYDYIPGYNDMTNKSYLDLLMNLALAMMLDIGTKVAAIYYTKMISSITRVLGSIVGLMINNIPFVGIFTVVCSLMLKFILSILGIPYYEVYPYPVISYISSNCEEAIIRVQKECYNVPIYYSTTTFAIGETLSRILIGVLNITDLNGIFDNLVNRTFSFDIFSILPYPMAVECHFYGDMSALKPLYSNIIPIDYALVNLYLLLHGYVSIPELIDLSWLTVQCYIVRYLTGEDLLWPWFKLLHN